MPPPINGRVRSKKNEWWKKSGDTETGTTSATLSSKSAVNPEGDVENLRLFRSVSGSGFQVIWVFHAVWVFEV